MMILQLDRKARKASTKKHYTFHGAPNQLQHENKKTTGRTS